MHAYLRLMRLNYPIAICLYYLPCLWGLALAYNEAINKAYLYKMVVLFAVGSFISRSAGCVINDIVDKDIDRFVIRTRNRPLANKEISIMEALIIFTFLSLLGCALLYFLPFLSKLICVMGIILMFIYPFSKRFISYPQFLLGISVNAGLLAAYTSFNKIITTSAALLYGAAIYWTMIYDTIYAYQDVEDDKKLGLNSTAVAFGIEGKANLMSFNIIMSVCIIIAGLTEHDAVNIYYYFIVIINFAMMTGVILKIDLQNTINCRNAFYFNNLSGILVLTAIIIGKLKIY